MRQVVQVLHAVEPGVDSNEHGTEIDKETLAEMAKKGDFLVPTSAVALDGDPLTDISVLQHVVLVNQRWEAGKACCARLTRHSKKGIFEGWASGRISTDIRPWRLVLVRRGAVRIPVAMPTSGIYSRDRRSPGAIVARLLACHPPARR